MNEIFNLAARLQRVKHFADIPIQDIRKVISSGRLTNLRKDQVIFNEGEECAGLFVLISGQVNLSKLSSEGKVGILNTISAVTMFNEVAALDGGGNPVTAIAHTDIRVWHLDYDQFQQLLRDYPQAGISLLGVLARRNRLMLSHYGDLSFRSVHARLAKHLLALSESGARMIDRREHSIHLIASHIITTPEAVSRTLKTLKCAGVIRVTRAEIEIVDVQGLNEMALKDF